MLQSIKELQGILVEGQDGQVGQVDDFYFDADAWAIRHIVLSPTSANRRVLVSPVVVRSIDGQRERIELSLTSEQVDSSPDIDSVKRSTPSTLTVNPTSEQPLANVESGSTDLQTQSAREFLNYRVQARDGEIGHIEDFLIDDQTWRINYLVIDTSNVLPHRKVILPPTWVRQVNWEERQVVVDLKGETIKNSPKFDLEAIRNQS